MIALNCHIEIAAWPVDLDASLATGLADDAAAPAPPIAAVGPEITAVQIQSQPLCVEEFDEHGRLHETCYVMMSIVPDNVGNRSIATLEAREIDLDIT